jgi:tRNA-dihydrouridine synthase B
LSQFLRPIQLPGLHLEGNIFLAPIAGYSDAAFREVCIRFGAYLCFTEMVSAEALARGSRKTLELTRRGENERDLAVQLFGCDPLVFGRAIRALEPLRPALYDLNCGCAVPKVLKTGAGAALLRSPQRIADILRAIGDETESPVSVKLRSGWDAQNLGYREAAEKAIGAGAAMLTLHPRTRAQGFSGRADWSHIRALKEGSPVPVIGSGDLFGAKDALTMMRETGCDGVMFGRGALGNPFLFAQTRHLLQGTATAPEVPSATASAEDPSTAERLQTALEHLGRAVALKGETIACREMRKHMCHYTKGVPGGAELRQKAVHAATLEEYRRLVREFLAGS